MKDHKYINIGKKTLKLYLETGMGIYAGNATLFIITAMFPLLMLIIAIVNALPGYEPSDVSALLFSLVPDLTAFSSFIRTIMSNLKSQSSSVLASVSALTALWSASNGVTALQNGLKKLGNTRGNTVIDKLRAILFTFLLIIFIPLLLVLQVFGSSIVELVTVVTSYLHIDGIAMYVHNFIQDSGAVMIMVAFVILLLTYTYLPGYKRRIRDQLPGTCFTTVVCILFTAAFSYFIPRFYHSSALYGSLASLFLVLLWLRFIMMMFFAGDALNVACLQYKQENENKD